MESAIRLLWNVKEAGAALGLSHWTIRRYIADQKLATVRLGRRVLVEPSECRRLVDENRQVLPPTHRSHRTSDRSRKEQSE